MAAKKKTRRSSPGKKKVAKKRTAVAKKRTAKKRPPGRPTKYSKALAARLCAKLAEGKSLRSACKLAGMPSKTTAFRWLASNEQFRDQYEAATASRADALAEDMLDIADDLDISPQHKRYMIDVRKWNAARMKHKRYGDKVQVGGDPDSPLEIVGHVTRTIIRK